MKIYHLIPVFVLGACSIGVQAPNAQNTPEPSAYEPPSRTVFVAINGDDNQSGAKDRPWRHIQYAIDHAGPSAQIYVGPGIYTELITISGPMASGINAHPSLLKSDGAIIDGSGKTPANERGLITIENASHIVVTGFELRNFVTPTGFSHDGFPKGIYIHGSGENIEISHNRIHDIHENSTCTQNDNNCSSAANGIGIYGDTRTGLKNIKLIANEVYDNTLGASEALTLNGNISGFIVRDNFVHDNNNIGFDFIGYEDDICLACTEPENRARNGIVQRNTAQNNSIIHFGANPWYGGEDGNAAGFYVDGAHHIVFENNISTGNDLGMEIASEAPGGSSSDILVASNLIYNNFDIGIALGGYDANPNRPGGGSTARIKIINNTLYHNQGHSSELTLSYRISDLDFINNIISGKTATDALYEAPDINAGHVRMNWDHNLWWADTLRDGIPVSDANGLIADPQFTNIENGQARVNAGAPSIDAGISQAPITNWSDPFWQDHYPDGHIPVPGETDIDNGPRLNGPLDMGASEF